VCAVFELPEVAIDAVDIFIDARCRLIIHLVDVVDCVSEAVCRCTLSPSLVFDHIISATFASVADRLECIPADGTEARGAAAGTHVHGVRRVAKVEASSVLS
jgi:hypothetical protein